MDDVDKKKRQRKKTTSAQKKTAKKSPASHNPSSFISGYGAGNVETIISVEEINRQSDSFKKHKPSKDQLAQLSGYDNFFMIDALNAGYGKMQILHDFNLRIGAGQSLCIIGPNGAGKSTVLHSIFGFTTIKSGSIVAQEREVTYLDTNKKISYVGIAYIMQESSIFPDMTVEENLWMGGFLKDNLEAAKESAELIFDKYPRLANRRKQAARILSGGEKRLLEIARALIMNPQILLVDEPSIGLEPKYINAVFDILYELQHNDNKTIIMVEQNAKKGLEFADIGYVMVAGELIKADKADNLLKNPEIGRLFLGG